MHPLTKILPLAFFPLSFCNPLLPRGDYTDLKCSANDSDAQVTDWSGTVEWKSQMIDCMEEMNNSGWNGASCQPQANGTALGPGFGFWKGETHNSNGQNCYSLCVNCLVEGINSGKGVTTSCQYTDYIGPWGPAKRWTCELYSSLILLARC